MLAEQSRNFTVLTGLASISFIYKERQHLGACGTQFCHNFSFGHYL